MKYSLKDFLQDVGITIIAGFLVILFVYAEFKKNNYAPVAQKELVCITMDTLQTTELIETKQVSSIEVPKKAKYPHHVNLAMLDSLAPYPVLAYATVVAESGWPIKKSNLASKVNNNIGMMIPLGRFHACTLKDTAKIRVKLGLTFGKDYNIYKVRGKPVVNQQKDTMVCYNGKWAIFEDPVACAKDISEYQEKYINANHAATPGRYINRLRALGYIGQSDVDAGYIPYWLNIYEKIVREIDNPNVTGNEWVSFSNPL